MVARQRADTMGYRYVLFDFESSIADLTECHRAAFSKSFKEFGMEYDNSRLEEYIRTPLEVLFEKYQKGCTCRFRDFVIITVAEFDSCLEGRAAIREGVVERLHGLKDSGAVLGTISECSEDQVRRVLSRHGIADMFSSVVGIERMAIRRPEAYPVNIALKEMGAIREDAVFVSGEERDWIAATKAGISSTGPERSP
ncbi:MAG: HAD family hydrolase [archaeon]|nr:HAD family hydrolase [archaeon]